VHLRNLDHRKKKEVNRNYIKKFFGGATARILCGSLAALAVVAAPGAAFAQVNWDKKI
jgi:hypothetical protein